MGSGREIRFWEDLWVGNAPLKDSFRILFGLTLNPFSLVKDSFDFERNIWIPQLHTNLDEWEMDELDRLLCLLESIKLNPNLVDNWVWGLNSKGIFTSKSFYLNLFCDRLAFFSVQDYLDLRYPV